VKHLSPAYFALVMATGIVSIAAWDFDFSITATGLFVFNLVAFAVLTCLTALRALRYPRLFLDDMTDHRWDPAFSRRWPDLASWASSFCE
jgi:tellurite resistance protein TehA-like permease